INIEYLRRNLLGHQGRHEIHIDGGGNVATCWFGILRECHHVVLWDAGFPVARNPHLSAWLLLPVTRDPDSGGGRVIGIVRIISIVEIGICARLRYRIAIY